VPISINGSAQRTMAAWNEGQEHLGYAIQWAAVYGHFLGLLADHPDLAERIMVVRYEDVCNSPARAIARLLEHTNLHGSTDLSGDDFEHIRAAVRPSH